MRTIAEIGQMRIKEMRLGVGGVRIAFSETELGRYSYLRKPVLVVMTGKFDLRQWELMSFTKQNVAEYRGHCYLVKGKRVRKIEYRHPQGRTIADVMAKYEVEDCGTPMWLAKTEAIFRAGSGHGTRKKPQRSGGRETANGREGSAGTMVIRTKRFSNSRLTCVYKSRS